jgi:hypothetical protein
VSHPPKQKQNNPIKMKKYSLFLLFFLSTISLFAQRKSRFQRTINSSVQIEVGTVLTYEVKNGGDEYDFVVTLKKLGDTIVFDYDMPLKEKKGTITILPNAAATATVYYNLFAGGDVVLKDKSSVVLSQKNFTELRGDEANSNMKMAPGVENFERKNAATMYVKYKGGNTLLSYFEAQSTSSTNRLWVMDNAKMPLIVKMDIGWSIELTEIK